MSRPPVIRMWGDAIIADNFAGGGGASSGIELAIGRSPDIAINHDPEALAMHAANHPDTRHVIENVWAVDPVVACAGRPVALAWFSPDCKHHSKAKGGKPREQKIRGLAWVAVRWAAAVKPRVIALENVEEFRDWGPLDADGHPIKARKGQTFRAFVRRLERLGYVVEHRLLRACDYGAPTSRRRLFLIARCDGKAIRWPLPSHGPMTAKPHRTAAECIDWSILMRSIFDRSKPHAEATQARLARGIKQFVLDCPHPYLLEVRDGFLVPYLIHRSNGERQGQAPRTYDIRKPLGAIVAQGNKHALVAAFLAKHYTHRPTGGWNGGSQLHRPMDTITTRDHHSLVAAHLIRYNGQSGPQSLDLPIGTLDTRERYALVASFLTKFYGTSTGASLHTPMPTITGEGQHIGLVSVVIDGSTYVLADILMRMIVPREQFRAQGFPDSYQITPIWNGKPLSQKAQTRMCGNSVSPLIAAALIRAQFDLDQRDELAQEAA